MKSLEFCQHCGKPKNTDLTYSTYCVETQYDWFFCEECGEEKERLLEKARMKVFKDFVMHNTVGEKPWTG